MEKAEKKTHSKFYLDKMNGIWFKIRGTNGSRRKKKKIRRIGTQIIFIQL